MCRRCVFKRLTLWRHRQQQGVVAWNHVKLLARTESSNHWPITWADSPDCPNYLHLKPSPVYSRLLTPLAFLILSSGSRGASVLKITSLCHLSTGCLFISSWSATKLHWMPLDLDMYCIYGQGQTYCILQREILHNFIYDLIELVASCRKYMWEYITLHLFHLSY